MFSDGRLGLRPWCTDDAAWLCESCQDPAIHRWTRVPAPYDMAMAEDFVARARTKWEQHLAAPFVLFDCATGDAAGSQGLVSIDVPNLVAEVGYWTAPDARGAGATTRGLVLLTDRALHATGLVRLEIFAEAENVASRKVAERAGYVFEGLFPKKIWHRGAHRDVALYARTA